MSTHIPALPSDDEILDAVLDVATTARSRATRGRPLPPIRTQEWLDLPYDDKVASLLVLACAWLAEDPRREELAEMKEVSLAVHGAVPRGYWGRLAFDQQASA